MNRKDASRIRVNDEHESARGITIAEITIMKVRTHLKEIKEKKKPRSKNINFKSELVLTAQWGHTACDMGNRGNKRFSYKWKLHTDQK